MLRSSEGETGLQKSKEPGVLPNPVDLSVIGHYARPIDHAHNPNQEINRRGPTLGHGLLARRAQGAPVLKVDPKAVSRLAEGCLGWHHHLNVMISKEGLGFMPVAEESAQLGKSRIAHGQFMLGDKREELVLTVAFLAAQNGQ